MPAKRRQQFYITERELFSPRRPGASNGQDQATVRLPPIIVECPDCGEDYQWDRAGDACPYCAARKP